MKVEDIFKELNSFMYPISVRTDVLTRVADSQAESYLEQQMRYLLNVKNALQRARG